MIYRGWYNCGMGVMLHCKLIKTGIPHNYMATPLKDIAELLFATSCIKEMSANRRGTGMDRIVKVKDYAIIKGLYYKKQI